MRTRCSDPRGSLAGALWSRKLNPPHKLNVFIVTARLATHRVLPTLINGHQPSAHACACRVIVNWERSRTGYSAFLNPQVDHW